MNEKVMASPLCFVRTFCLHLKVNIWPRNDLVRCSLVVLPEVKVKAPSLWRVLHLEMGAQKGLLGDTDARRLWPHVQHLCHLFDWRDHSCGFGGTGTWLSLTNLFKAVL